MVVDFAATYDLADAPRCTGYSSQCIHYLHGILWHYFKQDCTWCAATFVSDSALILLMTFLYAPLTYVTYNCKRIDTQMGA